MGHSTCGYCGEPFAPRRKDQSYCSPLCKTRARGKRQRAAAADTSCSVDGCGTRPIAGLRGGLCGKHYRRLRTTGDIGPAGKIRGDRFGVAPCSVEGCSRKYYANSLCSLHYNRQRTTGDVGAVSTMKRAAGEGCYVDNRGYRLVVFQSDGRTKKIFEHRLVMERILGRPLEPFENVHHLNGRRLDNRPENLELWTRPQPRGQRPEDLVAWVIEHYPDLVRAALDL